MNTWKFSTESFYLLPEVKKQGHQEVLEEKRKCEMVLIKQESAKSGGLVVLEQQQAHVRLPDGWWGWSFLIEL